MNGLEAIKERILSTAKEKASDYEFVTDNQIRDMKQEALEKAAKIKEQSSKAARLESDIIIKRANSMAASDQRKIRLASKQEQIDEVLVLALDKLSVLPADQKMELYVNMLEDIPDRANAQQIQFNQADILIGEKIINQQGYKIPLHPVAGTFAGGFILYRGNIEINMTFEMIAKQYRNELITIAADSLFTESQ